MQVFAFLKIDSYNSSGLFEYLRVGFKLMSNFDQLLHLQASHAPLKRLKLLRMWHGFCNTQRNWSVLFFCFIVAIVASSCVFRWFSKCFLFDYGVVRDALWHLVLLLLQLCVLASKIRLCMSHTVRCCCVSTYYWCVLNTVTCARSFDFTRCALGYLEIRIFSFRDRQVPCCIKGFAVEIDFC